MTTLEVGLFLPTSTNRALCALTFRARDRLRTPGSRLLRDAPPTPDQFGRLIFGRPTSAGPGQLGMLQLRMPTHAGPAYPWIHGAPATITAAAALGRQLTALHTDAVAARFTAGRWALARVPARRAFEEYLGAVWQTLHLMPVPDVFYDDDPPGQGTT